jgi:hypothetical protein
MMPFVAPKEQSSRSMTEQQIPEPGATAEVALPRYERPHEAAVAMEPLAIDALIPREGLETAIAASTLTPGARDLVRGLVRLGRPAMFGGGGAGIEYGSLLKTACRPEFLGAHIREVAAHLHERKVDLLMVPGMSGYPVGAMYSVGAGIPAILLKKQRHRPEQDPSAFPPGAFVIPSYTGDGDVVMSADLEAIQDVIDGIVRAQIETQQEAEGLSLTLRVAGADDIIDKATMSQAVSESALVLGKAAIATTVERYREETGDPRPVEVDVRVVTWVTPLIKGYNRPHEHLMRWFGITPFAGLNVTGVHLDPPAIGIEGLGVVGF